MYRRNLNITDICTIYYTLVVVFACTLFGHLYSSFFGVMALTVATLIAVPLCAFTALLNSKSKRQYDYSLIPIVVYSVYYIYAIYRGNNSFESIIPLASLVVCAYIGGRHCFNITMARKWIEAIGIIASALLILQALAHGVLGFHIQMLPSSILSNVQSSYVTFALYGTGEYEIYRPRGVFLEPAHFVHFAIIALASMLFTDNKKNKVKRAIFISIAIVVTISSTGLLLLVVVWVLWAVYGQNSKVNKWQKTVLISFLMLIFFMMLLSSSNSALVTYFQRILPSNLLDLADSQEGRYWANRYLNSFSSMEWIFGRGVGTSPAGYFVGNVKLIYEIGILGLVLFLTVIVVGIFNGNKFSRIIGLIYIILLFGAAFDNYRYILTYITIVYAGLNKKEKKKLQEV